MLLVVRIREVTEDRPRVDAAVDAQQRHPDALEVVVRERPEAAVRVAVFRTNAGMSDEGAVTRNREDTLGNEALAKCKHHVRSTLLEKGPHMGLVRAVGIEMRYGRRHRAVPPT